MKQVYLDNAATTAIRPEVIERITKVMRESYGNASSTHSFGRSSKALLEQCRKNIASYFNVSASEIVFTSGGTEADNLALRSAVRDLGYDEIITSKIEHHAVLHTAEQLQKEYNVKITYVDLNDCGLIDYSHLEQLLQKSNKAVVSLMHINNEVGNILDLERVATLCKANNALFHTDTVQSVGHYKIDLQNIPLDFLAASAHKFHGPKGVGMDEALKIAYSNLEEDKTYVSDLKDYFIQQLKSVLPEASFNGSCSDKTNSTYTLVNVCLPIAPAKAAMLQFQLDLKGIACSRGSACQSGSNQQSHVLTEILTEDKLKRPSIRFSFSIYNTKEELDYVIKTLNEFVNS